jgi:ankyrin repeat protein
MLGNARYACHIEGCTFTATRRDNLSRHLKIVDRQDLRSHLLKDSKEFRETGSSESGYNPGTEPLKSTPASSTPHQPMWTCNMFLQAATAGNLSVLEACITSGMDVNIVADDKSSPLHCAARAGHASAVLYLINRGADIEARNEKDRTPLQEAIIGRSSDAINLLLQSGAQLDISDVTVNVLAQSESQEILKLCFDHLGEDITFRKSSR